MTTPYTTFDGTIRDLSHSGLGVVDGPDGMIYFVQGTWPLDQGTFEVLDKKKRYGFAKLIELKQKSPHRISTRLCDHHGFENGTCGGCPWLPFEYEDQIKQKNNLIKYAIERSKIIDSPSNALKPIIRSKQSLGYRNRAQLKTNGKELGFVSYQSKTLVDIQSCPALNEECSNRLRKLRERLPNSNWRPTKDFLWNFIDINDQDAWNENDIQINKRLPFLQGNHEQNEAMKLWLEAKLEKLDIDQSAIELFCGSGNFTEILAKSTNIKSIAALEISEESIESLKQKKIPKTNAMALNLFKIITWNSIKKLCTKPTVLFLDPPREGFQDIENFVTTFKTIKTIFYVSCSVDTFARDAAALKKLGFHAAEIQPFDLFPNTPHIELCAAFYC